MGKLEASDAVVFGISIDSPAANNAFAQQIGVTFPLLSDMNRKVLTAYGILKMYDMKNEKYNWARRTTIIVDKQGRVQHIEFDNSALDPATPIPVYTKMQTKDEPK